MGLAQCLTSTLYYNQKETFVKSLVLVIHMQCFFGELLVTRIICPVPRAFATNSLTCMVLWVGYLCVSCRVNSPCSVGCATCDACVVTQGSVGVVATEHREVWICNNAITLVGAVYTVILIASALINQDSALV